MPHSKKDNGIVLAIFIIAISVLAFLAWLVIQIIHFARGVFWISLILMPIVLIVCIIYFFRGLFDEWEREDLWIVAGVALLITILLFASARVSYNMGYSEEAIKTELQMKGYLEWYDNITSILNTPEQVTNQAMEKTITNLCKDPTYPCDDVKRGYNVYKEVKGAKDTADEFSWILLIK